MLEDGLTVAGKPLREYYEAVGHAKAYDAMFGLLDTFGRVSEADICLLHALFYQQVDAAQAGLYRQQRVFISGSRFTPPPAKLPEEKGRLAAWMRENENSLHPAVFAAQVHSSLCSFIPSLMAMAGYPGS